MALKVGLEPKPFFKMERNGNDAGGGDSIYILGKEEEDKGGWGIPPSDGENDES